ncbi:hypothetical protein F5Y18DRAFT_433319 [Xylariaceae sp. FL1019]|nr:hypothetical protein F5Y18DRAFT_433319 [Xylariaceae sp. FL1019]
MTQAICDLTRRQQGAREVNLPKLLTPESINTQQASFDSKQPSQHLHPSAKFIISVNNHLSATDKISLIPESLPTKVNMMKLFTSAALLAASFCSFAVEALAVNTEPDASALQKRGFTADWKPTGQQEFRCQFEQWLNRPTSFTAPVTQDCLDAIGDLNANHQGYWVTDGWLGEDTTMPVYMLYGYKTCQFWAQGTAQIATDVGSGDVLALITSAYESASSSGQDNQILPVNSESIPETVMADSDYITAIMGR